jgi:phage terminase large subunit
VTTLVDAAQKTNRIILPYKFKPRKYQYNLLGVVPAKKRRGVFIHHRRAGKDITLWNKLISEAIKKPAVYYYFFPTYKQGRKILWDGIDARTGFRYLDHLPKQLITKKNDTEMKIVLKNGALIQIVGTDDFNAIMGTPPYGCVFSEFSLQNPQAWEYIRPILRENGGWAIFNFTPRGKNHGFQLYNMAKHNQDWFCETLTVNDTKRDDGTPVIPREAVEADRAEGMSDELIEQEYYCSFEGFIQGAYYAKQLIAAKQEGRIGIVNHLPDIEVDTYWDLGMDDSMTIWFVQSVNEQHRVIDYYENSRLGLEHYAKILKEKPYVYGNHHMPHDAEVHEMSSGEIPRSRKQVAEDLGIKPVEVIPRAKNMDVVVNVHIPALRNMLARCWFDEVKCAQLISALSHYHSEYDELKKIYNPRPEHDWSSHAADAGRTFALGYRKRAGIKQTVDDFINQYC